MDSEVKIPTLLGLSIMIAGLAIGVFLLNQNRLTIFQIQARQSNIPFNITVANLSSTSAAIFWQTAQPTTGFVQAGPGSSLNLTFQDERDFSRPEPHTLHFVILTNLTPQTTYSFTINSGSITHPQNNPLSFTTSQAIPPADHPPLVGTILTTDYQPVGEALVVLEIAGAQKLATITKMAGNFILPLSELKNDQLTANFDLQRTNLSAQLTIFDSQKKSQVRIILPLPSPLPPLTLGQDLNLISAPASSSATKSYDLNSDGVINSLDLSFLVKNLGRNPQNKQADLNHDGIVDQKDVDILNQLIPQTSPR